MAARISGQRCISYRYAVPFGHRCTTFPIMKLLGLKSRRSDVFEQLYIDLDTALDFYRTDFWKSGDFSLVRLSLNESPCENCYETKAYDFINWKLSKSHRPETPVFAKTLAKTQLMYLNSPWSLKNYYFLSTLKLNPLTSEAFKWKRFFVWPKQDLTCTTVLNKLSEETKSIRSDSEESSSRKPILFVHLLKNRQAGCTGSMNADIIKKMADVRVSRNAHFLVLDPIETRQAEVHGTVIAVHQPNEACTYVAFSSPLTSQFLESHVGSLDFDLKAKCTQYTIMRLASELREHVRFDAD